MAWHLSLENIAGIRQGDAHIQRGVNAVRASNWQGKSSFLAGIETAFGTAAPLTEGQSTGHVVFRTDDEEISVELRRRNGTVTVTGDPYLSEEYDRVCAELFAFLDEDNPVRDAVRNDETLESLLTRPLDFENIDEQISDRKVKREQIERELEQAKDAADRLPRLQQRVTELESELDELRAERADLDDDSAGETEFRQELSDLRAERDQREKRIDRLEGTVERLEGSLSEKRAALDSLVVPDDTDPTAELETVRSELRELERDRELLQSVYEANKRVLDEGRVELLTDVTHEMLADSVTCWLCGEDVSRDAIEAQLDGLDERISTLRGEAAEYRERVDELEGKRDEIRQARRRESDLEDRIGELESRLAEAEADLETAREARDELEGRIDELAETVDTTADRITDLESEIKYTEIELEEAREKLETMESRADRRSLLEDEYESVTEEITELRNRKDEVKRRTRDAFSSALDDLLERFETGFETAWLTSTFDLVVARDGREAQLDALSEGERELLGIVAALAGHEAFEVGDRVPVMLLDELGGLARDNVRLLVDYLEDRVPYLVLTAYPEYDGFDAHELSPSDWQVVSHGPDVEAPS